MLANQIQIASEDSAGKAAIKIDAGLEGIVSAEPSESSGRCKNFRIRRRGETSRRVPLIINDRAIPVFDQNSPAIGSDGGTCENGVNLIGDGLGNPDV